MIKLSTFMLDPVKAYELYMKEIEKLKLELEEVKELARQAQAERKASYKTMKEKVRQMGRQIAAMEGNGT